MRFRTTLTTRIKYLPPGLGPQRWGSLKLAVLSFGH